MSDANVADNTEDLSSLFKGSISNESRAATMPILMTELRFDVDEAADNQQDWLLFDGDLNKLLIRHPPTFLIQLKRKKTSHSAFPTKYKYHSTVSFWCTSFITHYVLVMPRSHAIMLILKSMLATME